MVWFVQRVSCELVSNLYLWRIRNNLTRRFGYCVYVVNWFQICIFDVSETIVVFLRPQRILLWIGFKFVSLTYQKQFCCLCRGRPTSCELVSNLYLWRIRNNSPPFYYFISCVVNWFQICIFDVSETIGNTKTTDAEVLWIGFKFVSLTYQKQ